MDKGIQNLIELAQTLLGEFKLGQPGTSAGSVAAALRTTSGHTYTGICVDLCCGIGFCAEHAAVAEMLKGRETEIESIVAMSKDGVLSPCGRCRELMVQVNPLNLNSKIGMPNGRIVLLRELLPEHWITGSEVIS